MPTSVLLVSTGPFGPWWRESILVREGIEVAEEQDYDSAYRALVLGRHPFFVLDHRPPDDLMPLFLWRVRTSGWPALPRGVLITASTEPSLKQAPVEKILSQPVHPDVFDHIMGELLGLQPRRECRRAVDLEVSAGTAGRWTVSGTAVDLCTGGMLVKCLRAIPLGERLTWRLEGDGSLTGFTVPGTVLRLTGVGASGGHHYYAVRFEGLSRAARERLARYLKGGFLSEPRRHEGNHDR